MSQQLYATDSLGGYFSIDDLSRELRYQAQTLQVFRKFVKTEPMAGKNKGDKVLFDKISNLTSNGGTIAETDTMPTTGYTITQGTLAMTEYGIAVPFTQKLENVAFVAVPESIKTSLRNSMSKVLDSAAAAEFQTSDYKAMIINTATTSFASGGAADSAAAANMSDKNVRDIVDKMKILNIPAYDGKNYCAVCSTNAIRGLYDTFEAKANQTTLKTAISGEVGNYYKTRFFEETNVLSNVLSSYYGEAVFFGDDAVREGVVVGEEVRMKIPTDYGRDPGLAWYYFGGFKKVWDYSSDAETRIIHVTST